MDEKELLELEKEARRLKAKYHKNWRRKNPEKVNEITKRYWLKKAQKLKEETNKEE